MNKKPVFTGKRSRAAVQRLVGKMEEDKRQQELFVQAFRKFQMQRMQQAQGAPPPPPAQPPTEQKREKKVDADQDVVMQPAASGQEPDPLPSAAEPEAEPEAEAEQPLEDEEAVTEDDLPPATEGAMPWFLGKRQRAPENAIQVEEGDEEDDEEEEGEEGRKEKARIQGEGHLLQGGGGGEGLAVVPEEQ